MLSTGVLSCAFALASAAACGPSPVITVVNASGAELGGVELLYSGGKTPVGRLRAAESRTFPIDVRGESDLRLQFLDARGHDEKIDVYIENGYRGSLTIAVQPNLKVRWKGRVRPWPGW